MKIWFDILTPKQLLFFEPMIRDLKKNHDVLCTSRRYREVSDLAKIRHFDLKIVGKHGGGGRFEKLEASLDRTKKLLKFVREYSPDILISFCSPEASRISFGLGIYHIAFSDSPHAFAVMKLSIPFIQKLLIPWIIPKKEFTKFGISSQNIIPYKSIDAASISKRKVDEKVKLPLDSHLETIIIRLEEEQASYSKKNYNGKKIINALLREFTDKNILILTRYPSQRKSLKKEFGRKVIILPMSYDGKILLKNADIFIGSGGTMTAESAMLGVPTISYNAVPNIIEEFLVRKTLIKRGTEPSKIVALVKNLLKNGSKTTKKKANEMINKMEDPYEMLKLVIKSLNKS